MIANIDTISPFDAKKTAEKKISFKWATKTTSYYKVIIFSGTSRIWTSAVVQNTVSNDIYYFTIPQVAINKLTNGNDYRVVVISTDANGNESDVITTTSGTPFSVYAVPVIKFENLVDGQIVDGKFGFKIKYSQSEGRFMTSGHLALYTIADLNTPIKQVPFPNNQQLDDGISTYYEIVVDGLRSSRTYYVQVKCDVSSQRGTGYMTYQTDRQEFKPFNQDVYGQYNFMTATNNPVIGGIVLSTSINSVNGKLFDKDGKQVTVETEDGSIDQDIWDKYSTIFPNGDHGIKIRNGDKMIFDDGWMIDEDFSIILYLTHCDTNERIFTMRFVDKDNNGEKVLSTDPLVETVCSLYYRESKNRHTDIRGFFELDVETKYTEPTLQIVTYVENNIRKTKTVEVENPQHSYYHRVYFTHDIGLDKWSSFAGRPWGAFKDNLWRHLRVGVMTDDLVCILINREENQWSIDADKYNDVIHGI